MPPLLVLFLAFWLLTPTRVAFAQHESSKPAQQVAIDIAPYAEKARDRAKDGAVLEALDALDEAALVLWDAMPLTVRKAVVVVEEPQGFGIYNVRENTLYDDKSPLLVYAELAGVGWRKSGNLWRTDLLLGFELKTRTGERLLQQDVFNTIATASRTRNREFFLHVAYSFNGLDDGDYVVKTMITDRAGNKKTEFDQNFSVKK